MDFWWPIHTHLSSFYDQKSSTEKVRRYSKSRGKMSSERSGPPHEPNKLGGLWKFLV